jgi:Family of unknown function (DUF5335)
MQRRVIPPNQWREALESFSRSHEGWIVRVTVTEPSGPSRVEAQDIPLQGVSADFDRIPMIAVMVGDRPDAHLTHEVVNPQELEFEQTESGAISALVVRSGDGTKTAIEFRSPMRPEDVDGLPFGRAVPS